MLNQKQPSGFRRSRISRYSGSMNQRLTPATAALLLIPPLTWAGNAIVGRLMPEHDPVYKVSIIPRGRALGVTMFLPEEDRHSISKRGIESNICSLYGGRIAEEMTLGKDGVTTGASNDIERATQYARNYVTKWGLSEKK